MFGKFNLDGPRLSATYENSWGRQVNSHHCSEIYGLQNWLKFLILASTITVLVTLSSKANADTLATEKILAAYEKAAFARADQKLTRFESKTNYKLRLTCLRDVCHDLSARLGSVLQPSLFKLSLGDIDLASDISILQYQDAQTDSVMLEESGNFNIQPGEHIYMDGQGSCRSITHFKNNTIIKIIVLIEEKMTLEQKEACVLVQTARGSGLVINLQYSDLAGQGYFDCTRMVIT